MKPVSPASAGRSSITGPSEKSSLNFLKSASQINLRYEEEEQEQELPTLQLQPEGEKFLWSLENSSVQSLRHVQFFATPWNAAHMASLSTTSSQSLIKLMSIMSVMPSSHLILCCPLLLLPPIPPSIRVFSNESTLHMRWPKY